MEERKKTSFGRFRDWIFWNDWNCDTFRKFSRKRSLYGLDQVERWGMDEIWW